jgi:hypothetical protein
MTADLAAFSIIILFVTPLSRRVAYRLARNSAAAPVHAYVPITMPTPAICSFAIASVPQSAPSVANAPTDPFLFTPVATTALQHP